MSGSGRRPGRRRPPAGGPRKEEQAVESDLVWGLNSVLETLRSDPGSVSEILVQQGKAGPRIQAIIDLARRTGVRLRFVEGNRMGLPGRIRHQGVVARRAAVRLYRLEELLDLLAAEQGPDSPRLLALDSIQDPRNLGSILRSAVAAGFGHVIMTRERSAPVTGTVARTSAGAVARLRLCQVVNLADTLGALKEQGFWIFGAVADQEALSIYEADFSGPACLVIGSEGRGIRPLVQRQCDHLVTIPMRAGFDSLNASVAAAVIMFEMVRPR